MWQVFSDLEGNLETVIAVGRPRGRGFKNQGSSPALFFSIACPWVYLSFEYERFELPSAFKSASSSQLLRKFYLEHGKKQGEVEARNLPNCHICH